MKRVILLCLLVSVFATVVALSEPVKVFPDLLWDQDALKYAPSGPGYPVLAVTELIDGDTFEALLHVAPQLVASVHIRVAFPDGSEVNTPEPGKHPEEAQFAKGEVLKLLLSAECITATLLKYDKYGRWVCAVTINGEIDLATWITDNGLTEADLCPAEQK